MLITVHLHKRITGSCTGSSRPAPTPPSVFWCLSLTANLTSLPPLATRGPITGKDKFIYYPAPPICTLILLICFCPFLSFSLCPFLSIVHPYVPTCRLGVARRLILTSRAVIRKSSRPVLFSVAENKIASVFFFRI